jgi:glycopeptide antibiotics resistance protein
MSAWAVADVTLNVLMFVPFGLLCHAVLRRSGWRPAAASAAAIGIAAAFTLGAESAQYFIVSRASQLEDVVLNGLGAGLGVTLGSVGGGSERHRPPQGAGSS